MSDYAPPLSEMEMDLIRHGAEEFGDGGNLVHRGLVPLEDRAARLQAFLTRHPGWYEREQGQKLRLIIARRNGARFLQD